MRRRTVRFPHDRRVEPRKNPTPDRRHIRWPHFEATAIRIGPVAIQVNEQIDSVEQARGRVYFEIAMDFSEAAGRRSVRAGKFVRGISQTVETNSRKLSLSTSSRKRVVAGPRPSDASCLT